MVTHRLVRGEGQGRVNYEIVKEALRRCHTVLAVAEEVAPDIQ